MVDRFSIRKPSSQNPAASVDIRTRGDLGLSECFIDGTFVVAKKGGLEQNFRRMVVWYEYHQENYLGFVHLGCILILLRS